MSANIITKLKKGSGTALYYMAIMFMILAGTVVFVEFLNGYSHIGKTQMYADLLANGGAFWGNNGFGMSGTATQRAIDTLSKENKKFFEDEGVIYKKPISYWKTNDKYVSVRVGSAGEANTVRVDTTVSTKTITTNKKIKKDKAAMSKIALTGGLRIVREAWLHTYECEVGTGKGYGQTLYTWGGGHDYSDSWRQEADCSGFVSGVFRACGYKNVLGATSQLETMGVEIYSGPDKEAIREKAMPGDIILYWYNGNASGASEHVVIYAGEYQGKLVCIECQGGEDTVRGGGPNKGAHINLVNNVDWYSVRRLVKFDDAHVYPAENVDEDFPGLEAICPGFSKIARLLLQSGYSKATVAGILGNISNEGSTPENAQDGGIMEAYIKKEYGSEAAFAAALNNWDVSLEEFANWGGDDTCGYGLCQWTTTGDWATDRMAKLYNFCKANKLKVATYEGQLAYMIHELKTSHGAAVFNSGDAASAATAFYDIFEKGGNSIATVRDEEDAKECGERQDAAVAVMNCLR